MKFNDSRWILKLYAAYTRFHFFSYGDQGFFVTKDLFQKLRGFRTDASFEDIEFYSRMRKVTRPVIIQEPVTTSARRFVKVGSVTQKILNMWLVGLYYLGFNILPLKQKVYPDIR